MTHTNKQLSQSDIAAIKAFEEEGKKITPQQIELNEFVNQVQWITDLEKKWSEL